MVDWMNPSEDAVEGRRVGRSDRQNEIDTLNLAVDLLNKNLYKERSDTLHEVCENQCSLCKQGNIPEKQKDTGVWIHYYKDSFDATHSYTCTANKVHDMF